MEEQFVTFETAVLAKDKGFDEICNDTYISIGILEKGLRLGNKWKREYTFSTAPTKSFLKDWLRIKKNLHVSVRCDHGKWYWHIFDSTINGGCLKSWHYEGDDEKTKKFTTYELAMEKALQAALKLIK